MDEPKKKKIRITAGDVESALQQNVNLICATCVHFHTAVAENRKDCGKITCGGPLVGKNFVDYSGQIPRSKFSEICLMCGDSKLHARLIIPNNSQQFALCEKHKDTFKNVYVSDKNILQINPIVIELPK